MSCVCYIMIYCFLVCVAYRENINLMNLTFLVLIMIIEIDILHRNSNDS